MQRFPICRLWWPKRNSNVQFSKWKGRKWAWHIRVYCTLWGDCVKISLQSCVNRLTCWWNIFPRMNHGQKIWKPLLYWASMTFAFPRSNTFSFSNSISIFLSTRGDYALVGHSLVGLSINSLFTDGHVTHAGQSDDCSREPKSWEDTCKGGK